MEKEGEFKKTKDIVDKIISREDEFTLDYVKDEVERNGGMMRVGIGCNIKNYLEGLVEIKDLGYDFFEGMYKTKKQPCYQN